MPFFTLRLNSFKAVTEGRMKKEVRSLSKSGKMTFILLGSLLLLGSMVQSCAYDVDVEDELFPMDPNMTACDTTGITYQGVIVPILDQQCNNCHGTGIGLGNVLLEPYAEVLNYVNNELLICSVLQEGGCSPMPKSSPRIPECEIASLQKWISDGAPNN